MVLPPVESWNDKVTVSSSVKLIERIEYVKYRDSPLVNAVMGAMQEAINGKTMLPSDILTMPGMSGWRYRIFINELIRRMNAPAYLEVGSWAGSTLCSAICGNSLQAMAIDNWSQFGGPNNVFFLQLSKHVSPKVRISVLNSDFREVNFEALGKYNVYLFDGPHAYEDQYDGIVLVQPALQDDFVLIVDDWNLEQVRNGTCDALNNAAIEADLWLEIKTTADGTHPTIQGERSEWHDGYFMAVCRKK